jgi:hypothetical protein
MSESALDLRLGSEALDTLVTWLPESDPSLLSQLALVVETYGNIIDDVADRCRVDKCVLAGIGSRESGWGLTLRPPGPGGTGDWVPRAGRMPADGGGFGRGLMQIDYDAQAFARSGPWKDPHENIAYACSVLLQSVRYAAAHTKLQGLELLRAGIAGYNCGPGNVIKAILEGRDVDFYTAHQNYSADTFSRARWFHDHGV